MAFKHKSHPLEIAIRLVMPATALRAMSIGGFPMRSIREWGQAQG